MWSVALASVIARPVLREVFADVSFRPGGRRSVRWFVIALLFPQFVGFVAFGAAWLTGLAPFTSTAERFWTTWLAASTVGTLVSCVYAAGEEIGWRGYMLTRLIAAGVPARAGQRPDLGALARAADPRRSAVRRAPLHARRGSGLRDLGDRDGVRLGQGPVGIGVVVAVHPAARRLQQRHQAAFWPAAAGGGTSVIWVDMEAGILVSAVLVLAAVLLCRGSWVFRRTPDEPMAAPAAL